MRESCPACNGKTLRFARLEPGTIRELAGRESGPPSQTDCQRSAGPSSDKSYTANRGSEAGVGTQYWQSNKKQGVKIALITLQEKRGTNGGSR